MNNGWLEDVKRMKTLADIGLLYAANEYDRERYKELEEISLRLLGKISGHEQAAIVAAFPPVTDYPTAKVDVRALLLSPDKKILLVQESNDGRWSLPGGWAEIGFTPSETIVKECREETGLDVKPVKLLAVFDKRMHPHPPQAEYVFKLVFYCEALTTEIRKGFDVLDVDYFDVEALPPLSEARIVKSQIETVYRKWIAGDFAPYFD